MIVPIPLALLAAALIALVATPEATPLFGLDHASFARAAFGVAFLVWLLLAGARRAGPAGIARVVSGALSAHLGWRAVYVGAGRIAATLGRTPNVAKPVGRVPAVGTLPPALANVADTAK